MFGVATEYGAKLLKLNEADDKKRAQLLAKIQAIEERLPAPLPVADGVRDAQDGRQIGDRQDTARHTP